MRFIQFVCAFVLVAMSLMGQTPIYNGIPTHENFLGGSPNFIDVVDFDRDGANDILATEQNNNLLGIRFLSGINTGTVIYALSDNPRRAAFTDLNADQQPDLVVLMDGSIDIRTNVNPYFGYPIFGFVSTTLLPTPYRGAEMVVKDVTGDGVPELIVLAVNPFNGYGKVYRFALTVNGNGAIIATLDTLHSLDTFIPNPLGLHAEDLDNDNDIDMLWAGNYLSNGVSNYIIANNTGTSTSGYSIFTSPQMTLHIDDVAVSDLDNDGDKDIALLQGGAGPGVYTFYNAGNAYFPFFGGYATPPATTLKIADLDDNGYGDFIITPTSFNVHVMWCNSTSVVSSILVLQTPSVVDVAFGDMDNDDDFELVTANATADEVSIFENQLAALGFAGNGAQLLRINGSLGGATGISHVVNVTQNQPIALNIDNTSSPGPNFYPANWVLFGTVGNPGSAGATLVLPGLWMAFTPVWCWTGNTFVLASSFSSICPFVQGTTAPWNITFPGVNFPLTVTTQAIIEKTAPSPQGFNVTVTNAVILSVL